MLSLRECPKCRLHTQILARPARGGDEREGLSAVTKIWWKQNTRAFCNILERLSQTYQELMFISDHYCKGTLLNIRTKLHRESSSTKLFSKSIRHMSQVAFTFQIF
eukprot:TRINITY_DN12207_c2_g1_i3.p1 TRINITY_DN12207_c2_g1~~TRINITY_DN12207_c2_g1_i3.p1  ORF type:complete len:106 (+),score=5.59 TRINITY_DN12207_c2_g1_i3:97-414(+)